MALLRRGIIKARHHKATANNKARNRCRHQSEISALSKVEVQLPFRNYLSSRRMTRPNMSAPVNLRRNISANNSPSKTLAMSCRLCEKIRLSTLSETYYRARLPSEMFSQSTIAETRPSKPCRTPCKVELETSRNNADTNNASL